MTRLTAAAAVALISMAGVACSVSADDAAVRQAEDRAAIS
jgi:hypothetical protein